MTYECFVQFQVAIEFVTYWDSGFGPYNWVILKNVIVIVFGTLALVFGSKDAIEGIMKEVFSGSSPSNATIAQS